MENETPAKKGPRTFPCGCSEPGDRCPEEGRLYGWLEASLRWGTALDQAEARAAYHGHFDIGRKELHQQERRAWAEKNRGELRQKEQKKEQNGA